jgi:hypothetical protein
MNNNNNNLQRRSSRKNRKEKKRKKNHQYHHQNMNMVTQNRDIQISMVDLMVIIDICKVGHHRHHHLDMVIRLRLLMGMVDHLQDNQERVVDKHLQDILLHHVDMKEIRTGCLHIWLVIHRIQDIHHIQVIHHLIWHTDTHRTGIHHQIQIWDHRVILHHLDITNMIQIWDQMDVECLNLHRRGVTMIVK